MFWHEWLLNRRIKLVREFERLIKTINYENCVNRGNNLICEPDG